MKVNLTKEIKDYWDRRPCNIRHSDSELGTKKYFDEVEERKYFVEPHIPKFADFAQWKGKRVLEIGCGSGKLAKIYLDENKKSKWYGLEPNHDYEECQIENFTLERSWFNSEYKLKDNYDAIVHSNIFEHSYNPIEFLQQ